MTLTPPEHISPDMAEYLGRALHKMQSDGIPFFAAADITRGVHRMNQQVLSAVDLGMAKKTEAVGHFSLTEIGQDIASQWLMINLI